MKNTMKTKIMMTVVLVTMLGLVSCDTQYKKTTSGLVYKIIRGNSKDSVARPGNKVKINVLWKFKDSVLFDNHGKMPQYIPVSPRQKDSYSFLELFPLMRKGDSGVVVMVV